MERVKKGSRIYYTMIGHNGFHYPSNDNSYLVTEEMTVAQIPWVAGGTKVPVKVNLPDDPARVMWVEKADLIKTSLPL